MPLNKDGTYKFTPRLVGVIVLLVFIWLSFSLPAVASICRRQTNHTICILSIQRSAKYYWEYRAAVSIDGRDRPIEKYNCRDRVRIRSDGDAVPFESQGAGEFICHLAHQK